jgi:hypothetical protein
MRQGSVMIFDLAHGGGQRTAGPNPPALARSGKSRSLPSPWRTVWPFEAPNHSKRPE